ncbi:MAG: YgiQ family radical SAM protein [Eubacterium sp.]|nr:YgiQ family radical SAM protein [Eubacterium sp.]
MSHGFLPINKKEMLETGWDRPDFVYVSGDAYVDHPSFGAAIITRILEAHGYRVCVIAQPDFRDEKSVMEFGEPRLGFMVSSGNMDSLVNHYTVAKKHRQADAYSPGGVMGLRPDRAVIVYCNLIRKAYGSRVPIVIGGLEASLRRLSHYDYWSNKIRRSILLESGANIICYGMGEHNTVEVADALNSGLPADQITFVDGTVYKTRDRDSIYDAIALPSFEEVKESKRAYAESFRVQYENTDPFAASRMYETYDNALYVVQNPPAKPLTQTEMDDVYALPYTGKSHPIYDRQGGIPALSEVKFSITSNRGCFGACNFCALNFHQGRIIQSRSKEFIVAEAVKMTKDPEFKGYIHDVGGPTADFMEPACKKQLTKGACKDRQCLFPEPCPNLKADHSVYMDILRTLRKIPGVKKVFVRSGIRFDYVLADKKSGFLRELCEHHISGQLRVAPEHVSDRVLSLMGKPKFSVYEKFISEFDKTNEKLGKDQYAVPYLMSSHPGATLDDAIEMALYLNRIHHMPKQVQDFYPTPGTISTCMYYTGLNPLTMEKVYVARHPHDKAMQRALMQFRLPGNYDLVKEALVRCHRTDLIPVLIPYRPGNSGKNAGAKGEAKAGKKSGTKSGAKAGTKAGANAGSNAKTNRAKSQKNKATSHKSKTKPRKKSR